MRLIVSSLSPHNLHLLLCCTTSILASYDVLLCCDQEKFSFSFKVSLFIAISRPVVILAAVISLSLLFLWSPWNLVLMHARNLQYKRILFLCFLIHIVCLCHPSDKRPCASSSTFVSSGSFVWVTPLSILIMVQSILQEELPRCLSLWCDFCRRICYRAVFLFVLCTLFLLFSMIFASLMVSSSNISKYL